MTRKYRNVPTEIDGRTFASKREAMRYAALKLMQRAGHIGELECQPRYVIEVMGKKICTYVADFRYREKGAVVVEDVKGVRTPVYRLKARLMAAVHGIEVREV